MYISLGKVQSSMGHGNFHPKKKPQQNSRTQLKPKMSARECTRVEASPKEQVKLLRFLSNNSDVSIEFVCTFVRWTCKL
jgi:hypothetical protein